MKIDPSITSIIINIVRMASNLVGILKIKNEYERHGLPMDCGDLSKRIDDAAKSLEKSLLLLDTEILRKNTPLCRECQWCSSYKHDATYGFEFGCNLTEKKSFTRALPDHPLEIDHPDWCPLVKGVD